MHKWGTESATEMASFDEVSSVTIGEDRKDYSRFTLREADVDPDPIRQFDRWFGEAVREGISEPHAMTLATCTKDGRPSARVVLLRGIDQHGFSFFTNYESRKARELETNPWGALVFYWHDMERQVRVEGRVERVSAQESDEYFHSPPSQLADRRVGLTAEPGHCEPGRTREFDVATSKHNLRTARSRPPNWGGYRLVPTSIEFWQGRPSRLHDRLRYTRKEEGGWLTERLAP